MQRAIDPKHMDISGRYAARSVCFSHATIQMFALPLRSKGWAIFFWLKTVKLIYNACFQMFNFRFRLSDVSI